MVNTKNIHFSLIAGFVLFVHFCAMAQKPQLQNKYIWNFEESTITPWIFTGKGGELTSQSKYEGKQALLIYSGSSAECPILLSPNSTYRITAHGKTESGSDLLIMQVKGLGHNNISHSSALADWVELKKEFVVSDGQTKATIEFSIAATPNNTNACIDHITVERIGDYIAKKESGISPLPPRTQVTNLGITTQPNEKLNWMLDAKFGMFIHWGLYAGPATGEWVMENRGMSPEEYRKLAYPESGDKYFAANKFDARAWATLAKAAGMKYMNLTTQHHDGYALFESKYMNAFTSKQTHNRDFVKEYVEACREQGLRVGIYKTLINWRFPGYYDITGTDCKKNKFGYTTDSSHKENARLMKEELYCQVKELVTNYGQIDQIFWDGGWLGQKGTDAESYYFWESGKYMDKNNEWPVNPYFQDIEPETGKLLGLMGMVRKYQPDVLVNPRCGWYGDYKCEEGSAPVTGPIKSEDVYEKCMSIAHSWGYNKTMEDPEKVMTLPKIQRMLSDCVVRNMCLLINVGPDRSGQIPTLVTQVLLSTGKWLDQVGEAVYGTRGGPWNPVDGKYGYAYKGNTIYVYFLGDFTDTKFTMPALNAGQKIVKAYNVTDRKPVEARQNSKREIQLSRISPTKDQITIIAVELNKNVMP